jgi:hypothetical protein
MFKNTFQSGFLSILYSIGSKPLQIWDKKVRNGHIKRITDNDIQSLVLEIVGTNVSTSYITCPADPKQTLGIKLPFLVMIIKNMKKYFTFEVQVNIKKSLSAPFFVLICTRACVCVYDTYSMYVYTVLCILYVYYVCNVCM